MSSLNSSKFVLSVMFEMSTEKMMDFCLLEKLRETYFHRNRKKLRHFETLKHFDLFIFLGSFFFYISKKKKKSKY